MKLYDEFCGNLLKRAKFIEPQSEKFRGDGKSIARSQPFRRDKKSWKIQYGMPRYISSRQQ